MLKKLPDTRQYEIYGNRGAQRDDAFSSVMRDIEAANALGIPFTVQTVATAEYVNGGNVKKGEVLRYVVRLGVLTEGE